MLLRESVPRQVDKKKSTRRKRSAVLNEELGVKGSGVLNEDLGVWNSQGEGNDKLLFFLSAFLSLSQIKVLFCFVLFFFKPGTDDYTTQFKLCTSDYITTMYSA